MNHSYNIKNNKIAILIILVSLMFLLFHLLTGTLSKKQTKIEKLMFEDNMSKRKAEERYYEEAQNDSEE